MWLKGVILLVLLATGVQSDCQCFEPQNSVVVGLSASVNNAFSTDTFDACYSTPCGFIANSGSNTTGWNTITITWAKVDDKSASLVVYDGISDAPGTTVLANLDTSTTSKTFASSSQSIYIKYTQQSTTSGNIYFGTVQADGALSVPTTPATTTIATTTTPYTPGIFAKNPQLISHDILIVVNPKNPLGINGLNALNTLVGNFVDQLAITYSNTSASQSRLALATITPYAPYASIQGTIWGLNATLLKSSLPKAGISYDGDITSALTSLLDNAFSVNSAISATRTNVQRTILLFTSDWPSGSTLDDSVKTAFLDKGANLGVISYNLTDTTPLNVASRWYNTINLNSVDNTAVSQFVNPFFFNVFTGTATQNYWCPKGRITTKGNITYFSEPSNYNGPCADSDGASCSSTWTTTFDGQSGTYCNYQNSEYSYDNPYGASLTVTVFYELEIEKDYLRFYADDIEIESFTGVDVYSSSFTTNAKVLRARFQTDNQAVYRGFYVQIQKA